MDRRRLIAFFAMVFGMFMSILDIQIVSASLAEIQAGLGAGSMRLPGADNLPDCEVIMIPLSGTHGAHSLHPRAVCHLCGWLHHFQCALRHRDEYRPMIVYRAIQGFIGGGMIPSVFAAAFTLFPALQAPDRFTPIIGLVATLAPTIGPTVGGYLSNAFSWHWLFLVKHHSGIIVTILTLEPDRFRQAGNLALEEV